MFEDPQSSDEESPIPDEDSCEPDELQRLYQARETSAEISVSLKRTCGLHLSLSKDARKLALGHSRRELQLYQLAADGHLTPDGEALAKYKSPIRGVKFFNEDPNLILAGTEDGKVTLYDVRSAKAVHVFEESSEGPKLATGFDINQNDRVLCASTEVLKNGDSLLMFYDIRERKYLGSYWECHSEDITNVKFHPTNPDLLASGSVDGLINVFDISKPDEDDAMQYCLNVNNSIEALNWHRSPTGKDWISCITTTNDFHLYDVESQDPEVEFEREKLTEMSHRKSSIDCNVIAAHNYERSGFFLLVGSNYNKGECLRSLKYDSSKKQFQPHENFLHNKQIVRASVYHPKENMLITTGESGLLTLWRCCDEEDNSISLEGADVGKSVAKKAKQKTAHRAKPY